MSEQQFKWAIWNRHLTLFKVKVTLQCCGIYPSILCPLNIFWTLERFIVNYTKMPFSVKRCAEPINRVCRLKVKINFQGQGIYPLQFSVRSISPEPFERFSLNFIQMFLSVRRCAEHVIQLCSVEVDVRVQGHGIYPWSWCLLHISWALWKFFIKLHPNVSHSETVCRSSD